MKTILIIEDDAAIIKGLQEILKLENYKIISSRNGEDGFKMALRETADLIILDLNLPGKNGIDICRDLRKENYNMPILMLTSRKEEVDKILGLEIGADDYVTKPFSVRELLARVKALLRRTASATNDLSELVFDKTVIDFKKHEAFKNKKQLRLSATEFKILKYFSQRTGEVVTREMLLDEVWGFENYPSTRTVDNFILSLRKQIEDDPANPKHLITVHKVGYKFVK